MDDKTELLEEIRDLIQHAEADGFYTQMAQLEKCYTAVTLSNGTPEELTPIIIGIMSVLVDILQRCPVEEDERDQFN
jgi:hypothetical protein